MHDNDGDDDDDDDDDDGDGGGNDDDHDDEEEDFCDQVSWEDIQWKQNKIRVGHTETFLYEHFTQLTISQLQELSY